MVLSDGRVGGGRGRRWRRRRRRPRGRWRSSRSTPARRRAARRARPAGPRIVSSSSVTGWIRIRTPAAASVAASSIGERPPSTALYSSGVPARAAATRASCPASSIASTNTTSAPASTNRRARSIASSTPATATASVRAMTTVSGERRDSTAMATRSTASASADDLLVLEVPAALRRDLVLDLHRRRARGLDLDDGAPHVQRAAEAGVDVGDERDLDARRDPAHGRGDVVEAEQAEIGDARATPPTGRTRTGTRRRSRPARRASR